jgi:hypothetical protein
MNASSTAYQELMASVGSCLHSWALVETAMELFFYNASGIKAVEKAGAIFCSIVAFEGRIAMLDAAVEHEPLLTEEEKAIWTRLSTRLRKFYRRRHAVAHFSVHDLTKVEAISPFFTWNKFGTAAHKTLTREQISARSNQFLEASAAVSWFSAHMQSRRLRIPLGEAHNEEPPMIARIRELQSRCSQAQ